MSLHRAAAWVRNHRAECAVLLLGCLLRVLLLNVRSLWFDETATLYIAQSPLHLLIPRVAGLEENPPLHYLLMHFWLPLFSDPVLALRLSSALCGMVGLALFMSLCRRLVPEQALAAGALAAMSSFWIHFAQDGRIYSLLLLLALAAAHFFWQLQKDWSAGSALGYGATALAGLYTHNFFLFVLAGQACYLLYVRRQRWQSLGPWLALYGLVLVGYWPWLSCVRSQVHLLERASVLQERLTPGTLCAVAGTMVFDTSFLSFAHEGWTALLGLAALLAVGVGLLWPRRRLSQGETFCLVQVLAALFGLRLTEFWMHRAATQARYLIGVSPWLYVLLACAWDRPGSGWGRALRLAGLSVVAAGTAGYFAGGLYVDPHLDRLARALRRADSRAPIVYLDPFYYLPMRYYYLPERAQHLAGPRAGIANWEGLPGYRAYLTPAELARTPRCVIVDPRHQMLPRLLGTARGSDVALKAFPPR